MNFYHAHIILFHLLLFVKISDVRVSHTAGVCVQSLAPFLVLDEHHNTVGVLVVVAVGLNGCDTSSSSVGVLQHPTTPGVINFPTEEHPVMGHLTGGEQFAPRIPIGPFWHNVPRRNYPFVNHL